MQFNTAFSKMIKEKRKVFKFGGASIQNADAIRNVGNILGGYKNEPIFIVISALGKSTDRLENVVNAHAAQDGKENLPIIEAISLKKFSCERPLIYGHRNIV